MTDNNTSRPPSTGAFAPAPQRYQAAWAEVNARIQSRLVIQGSFMTGVVVTVLLGLVRQGDDLEDPTKWRMATVVLLPALTLATALWVRHNDAIIGLLGAFMQKLEYLDDPDQNSGLPGWQDTRYKAIDEALQYRMFSDYAFILVGAVATFPAAVLLFRGAASAPWLVGLVKWISPLVGFGLGCGAMWLVATNARNRRKIKDGWDFVADDKGIYRWRWK